MGGVEASVIRDSGTRALLRPSATSTYSFARRSDAGWHEEIVPHVDAWEQAREFPRELYNRAAELGFLGLKYPAELGRAEAATTSTTPFGRRSWRRPEPRAGSAPGSALTPGSRRRPCSSSAPPTSTSVSCARRSAARKSPRSGSPSRARRLEMWPRSAHRPGAPTTAGSSTARRRSSPTACAPLTAITPLVCSMFPAPGPGWKQLPCPQQERTSS